MRKFTATVSPNGQVTLPVELRRRFQIDLGDRIEFSVDEDDNARLWLSRTRRAFGSGSLPSAVRPKDR